MKKKKKTSKKVIQSAKIESYFESRSQDLFSKCEELNEAYNDLDKNHFISNTFAVPFQSGLDRTIKFLNPRTNQTDDWLCFDSNGYLGLHQHSEVKRVVKETVDLAGAGTPSVPLLGGSNKWSQALENRVAQMHQREAGLIFSSVYATNLGVVSGLVRDNDAIVIDGRAHASLHDAARMSRCEIIIKFETNKMESLEAALKKIRKNKNLKGILVITDGIFSMSGEIVRLKEISELSKKYNAKLLVDEAHSVGVVGKNGYGVEDHFELFNSIDILIGSFSKAFGFSGGYVVGKKSVMRYLRFSASTWVFSTAMPSAVVTGINKAVDLHMKDKSFLNKFTENRNYLWKLCAEIKLPTPKPVGGILPVFIGSNEKVIEITQRLAAKRIRCGAVAFPAVPKGQGILRIVPTALHEKQDFEILVAALKELL